QIERFCFGDKRALPEPRSFLPFPDNLRRFAARISSERAGLASATARARMTAPTISEICCIARSRVEVKIDSCSGESIALKYFEKILISSSIAFAKIACTCLDCRAASEPRAARVQPVARASRCRGERYRSTY